MEFKVKSKDFRLGNLIQMGNKVIEVTIDVLKSMESKYTEGVYLPLKLNENFLKVNKLFEYSYDKTDKYPTYNINQSDIGFIQYSDDAEGYVLRDYNGDIAGIDYIHQLQNLFYSLTREELVIN